MQVKTIFSILYKALFDTVIYTVILSAILAFLPSQLFKNFPCDPISYEYPNIPENISFWNNKLDSSEFLYLNEITGPESMVERDGFIYTGLVDGRIMEINKKNQKIRTITRVVSKKGCADNVYWKTLECGRPLGLRFHKDGHLYVIDAIEGLLRINVKSGIKENIKLIIPDDIKGLYNDFVFDPKLNIAYISISSRKWQIDQVPWSFIDHEDTGMVIAADLDTKKVVKLFNGLRFSNGIDVTSDNLLISETAMFRILKVPLKSIHKAIKANQEVSKTDIGILAKELPGEPDNIRVHGTDILVAIGSTRNDGKTIRDYMSTWTYARKALARLLYTTSLIFDYINTKLWANHALETTAFQLYSGHILYDFMPKNAAILRLDSKTGEMKQLIGTNKFNSISEALIDSDGDLYFGSFRNKFLGRLKKGKF